LHECAPRSAFATVPLGVAARRLAGLPRSVFGTALAHLGLGLTLLGIVSTLLFGTERNTALKQAETTEWSGYALRFDCIARVHDSNYDEDQVHFALARGGQPLGEVVA